MQNIVKIFKIIIDFIKHYKVLITILLLFFVTISVIKKCEKEPVVIKTTVDIEKIKDSIRSVLIKEINPVYIDTGSVKYIKGDKIIKWRDSIVYVDKPSNTTIKANQYETTLKSNNADAKLKITTSGELLDVSGIITYPKETITNTITKTKNKSGLFLYANAPINTNYLNAEIGLFYQFKNTFGLMGGVEYNNLTKGANIKIGLAIKIN